jgi:hypothetical protein
MNIQPAGAVVVDNMRDFEDMTAFIACTGGLGSKKSGHYNNCQKISVG